MLVGVPVLENNDNPPISVQFGRAPYFAVVDAEAGKVVKIIENTARAQSHGSGTTASSLLLSERVERVVAVSIGPRALRVLEEAGVKVYQCSSGERAVEAAKKCAEGKLPLYAG